MYTSTIDFSEYIAFSGSTANLHVPAAILDVELEKQVDFGFKDETRINFFLVNVDTVAGQGYGFEMNLFNHTHPIGEEESNRISGNSDSNKPILPYQLDNQPTACITQKQLAVLGLGDSIELHDSGTTEFVDKRGFVRLQVLKNLVTNHQVTVLADRDTIRLELHRYGKVKHGFDFAFHRLERRVLRRFLKMQ